MSIILQLKRADYLLSGAYLVVYLQKQNKNRPYTCSGSTKEVYPKFPSYLLPISNFT